VKGKKWNALGGGGRRYWTNDVQVFRPSSGAANCNVEFIENRFNAFAVVK